jgi:glutathione synthase
MFPHPRERLAQAVDYALSDGLLKYTPSGSLHHAPFTLTPCPIPGAIARELEALTAPFNALAWAVSRDTAFLEETLGAAAAVDEYTAFLLNLARGAPRRQPLELLVSRSDYFLAASPAGGPPRIRQVELNTIAASYPALAGRTHRLHRRLWNDRPDAARMLANDPAAAIADAMAEAIARYGQPGAVVAMVVEPGEANLFDQRLLELELRERGIETLRVSLAEAGERGALREGHLVLHGRIAALAYYRTGYAPDHLATPAARAGMERIAQSSAIAIPSPALHLAGAKKVQQVLAAPATLRRFADDATARRLEATFAALLGPEDPVAADGATRPAWQAAMSEPRHWVLKPQREGGGNNLFDLELVQALRRSTVRERQAYILMERILPISHPAWLVREGTAEEAMCVSEIGRFGTLLADGASLIGNRDAGYLVRTRPAHLHEGGVSAGFGFLDSLFLDPP